MLTLLHMIEIAQSALVRFVVWLAYVMCRFAGRYGDSRFSPFRVVAENK